MRNKNLFWASLIFYLVGVVGFYAVAQLPLGDRGVGYLVGYLFLTVLFVFICSLSHVNQSRLFWVVWVGIVARLILLGVPSFNSHDGLRYFWDGWIAFQGEDPYVISPKEFSKMYPGGSSIGGSLAPHSPSTLLPDSADLPTIYPPLALMIFSWLARFGPTVAFWLWKGVVTLCSILTLWLSWQWLKAKKREAFVVIPALFPLLILEAGVGAHLDVIVAFALLVAVLAQERKRDGLAGGAVAIGVLVKLYPLVLVPLFILNHDKKRALRFFAGVVSVIGLGYGLAMARGWSGRGSLGIFLQNWSFGSPVEFLLRWLAPPEVVRTALLVGFLGCFSLFLFQKYLKSADAVTELIKGLSILWLFSPVVFPWYLVSLVVLTSLRPSLFILIWASLHPLTYEVIDQFDVNLGWHPSAWPLCVVLLGWLVAPRLNYLISK